MDVGSGWEKLNTLLAAEAKNVNKRSRGNGEDDEEVEGSTNGAWSGQQWKVVMKHISPTKKKHLPVQEMKKFRRSAAIGTRSESPGLCASR